MDSLRFVPFGHKNSMRSTIANIGNRKDQTGIHWILPQKVGILRLYVNLSSI
jgi:hypothetical protein